MDLDTIKLQPVITCKNGYKILKIPYSDIYFIETVNRKVFLYTETSRYELKGTISDIEELLTKHSKDFFRSHRDCIINIHQIKVIENGLITLLNNTDVPLSRLRNSELKLKMSEVCGS